MRGKCKARFFNVPDRWNRRNYFASHSNRIIGDMSWERRSRNLLILSSQSQWIFTHCAEFANELSLLETSISNGKVIGCDEPRMRIANRINSPDPLNTNGPKCDIWLSPSFLKYVLGDIEELAGPYYCSGCDECSGVGKWLMLSRPTNLRKSRIRKGVNRKCRAQYWFEEQRCFWLSKDSSNRKGMEILSKWMGYPVDDNGLRKIEVHQSISLNDRRTNRNWKFRGH
jgi:hypothetical protein